MPTQNRRVATYLPPELDDRLKAFIEERGLKGDSPALITILSEFFGVGHKVAQVVDYSNFVTKAEFLELSEKVLSLEAAFTSSSLPNSILGELPEKLKKLESRINCLEAATEDLEAAAPPVESHPGQMSFLDSSIESIERPQCEPLELQVDPLIRVSQSGLQPLNGAELAKRFGLSKNAPSEMRRKYSPDKFREWSIEKDPNDIPWRYDATSKKYHPIVNSSPISFSSSPV